MKKILLVFVFMFSVVNAQDKLTTTYSQISVKGTGKVYVQPDQVNITVGVENKGDDAKKVKNDNDLAIAEIIKYISRIGVSEKDYQTQRINLHKNRDYKKGKDYFQANQTVSIKLKDISKYEELIFGLIEVGANQIQNIEFKYSKEEDLQTEVRTKAIIDAKKKATDYANALGQRLGKVSFVSDEPVAFLLQQRSSDYLSLNKQYQMSGLGQTLAVGEIEISSNVSVVFMME